MRVCWCGAPSLTRGRVCQLQLLLAFEAQSFSGPNQVGLNSVFYCVNFETPPPNLEGHVSVMISPRNRWPSYTWVPFSSPPTTRSTTVDVFQPATTRRILIIYRVMSSICSLSKDCKENSASKNYFIVVCLFVA
jgi:hypothetical protein